MVFSTTRRPPDLNVRERALTGALSELIREGRVQMMGAIRQELLSGLREEEEFVKLRNYLRLLMSRQLTLLTRRKLLTCIICTGVRD